MPALYFPFFKYMSRELGAGAILKNNALRALFWAYRHNCVDKGDALFEAISKTTRGQ
jgi:hypothetical protein